MSSTQMDFSPQVIDRKQDITSWPEGEIDRLTTRDKNRYQKRKSAIIEYFQSDLPVEEIASRHSLPASDSIETLVERCCVFHEDGRPWGFRALVPGARVIKYARPDRSDSSDIQDGSARKESANGHLAPHDSPEDARDADEEDTAKRRALKRTDITDLPETPLPETLAENDELEDPQTEAAPSEKTGSDEILPAASVEVASGETVEVAAEQREMDAAGTPADTEVEQEEFPIAASVTQIIADAEVEQEEFPLPASVIQILDDAGVKQEEFPTTANEIEVPAEAEEEQEALVETTGETADVGDEVNGKQEALVEAGRQEEVAEDGAVEEVEQEEFSGVEAVVEKEEEAEPAEDLDLPGEPTGKLSELQRSEQPELLEEVADEADETEAVETQEPGAEGSDELTETENVKAQELIAREAGEVAEVEENEAREAVVEASIDEENVKTQELSAAQETVEAQEAIAENQVEPADEENIGTRELVTQASEVQAAEATEEDNESAEVAEMDTVEVAKVEVNERLDRVAATDTIKVPAAMLEALEKADQGLLTKNEAAPASSLPTESTGDDTADRSAATLPAAVSAQEETQLALDKTLAGDEIEALPTQALEVQRRDNRQLSQARPWKTPSQSLAEESRYRITGSQAAIKHSVLRRWGKQGREMKYRRWVRIVSAAVIVSLLVILLIPLAAGLIGYSTYTNIKGVANDGVNNLLAIKNLMPANKSDITSVLNTQKLAQAKTSLAKAQSDFLQLQDMVNRPDVQSLLQQFAPQYSGELDQARRLVQVALDVSQMGQELIGVAQMGANILHGGALLSTSAKTPLLTADNINTVEAAITHAQYYINDIQAQMSQVNLDKLPLGSKAQKDELKKYLGEIPQIQSLVSQAQTLVGPVAWMLGIGQARHFLVQTLDRAELRPSGGFEGQYGILTLQNGRMSPFTLKDITQLDYAENGAELNRFPPSQYSWMNFGFWGVRDANLSADFPTNAQLVMRVFQEEGGGPIDGDIQFTPVLISQLLQLTGPLYVKEYHETITAQNLEDKLHYYQQDYNAINVERNKTGTSNTSTRKAFTALVGKLLLDRVHSLKISQLMDFSKVLLQDLKTRDLQVYLSNPEAEQWLVQNGYSGAMPRFTDGNDGFMVVQANISISKATQYVHSTFNDQVTLDSQGGATHNLTITLNYNQKGPIYGFDTYTDYVRVYAPANAQFQGGSGFVDTKHTLCTPATKGGKKGTGTGSTSTSSSGTPVGCTQYNGYYPGGDRYCSSGNYSLGTGYVAGKGFIPWPVYAPSGPTETQSDLPGYKMWGGLTQTPKNCTSTITLSWYVPHVAQNTPGKAPYQMIVGHQAGWPDTAKISINARAWKGAKSLNYNQTINVDTLVALPALPLPQQPKPGKTPTPAITPTATPKKP